MDIIILIGAMVVVGIIIGAVAGAIWKDNRPIGTGGDYIVAIIVAVVVGLMDWYIIPAMGFEGKALIYLAVALEPALGALFALWLIRRSRQ